MIVRVIVVLHRILIRCELPLQLHLHRELIVVVVLPALLKAPSASLPLLPRLDLGYIGALAVHMSTKGFPVLLAAIEQPARRHSDTT
jgi:hypothetical protein